MSHPLEKRPEFVYVRASTAGRKNRQWVVMLKVPQKTSRPIGFMTNVVSRHRSPSKLKAMNKALTYLVSLRLEGRL